MLLLQFVYVASGAGGSCPRRSFQKLTNQNKDYGKNGRFWARVNNLTSSQVGSRGNITNKVFTAG